MVVVQSPWRPWTPMDSHAKEGQAQPQGGPSSRSRHSHEEDQAQGAGTATKRTKLKEHADGYHSGARETRAKGTVTDQRRRSSVEGVDTAQEAQGCQAGEAPEQYSMKKVLSGERAGAASLAMLRRDRTEGSSPLRSGDHFKHQVNTLDTRVDATNLITNTINLIIIDATNLITNTINLIIIDITNLITNTINLIIINTHTRPWCHHNIDIDRAELPLNGVSTEVSRNLRYMTIGQSGYIDQVLAKHLDKCTKPTMVPMQSIPEGTLVASTAQQKEYLVIVGKLLWVANSTQPNLSLTMSILARHMHEPSQEHYQAAQWVLCYLKGTKKVGLVYRGDMLQEPLIAHSDANWVSKDPAQHWKLKHIDTKYHFICNNVQEGRVQIKYVDTTRNLADVLTKPIRRQAMQQARSGLHLQILAVVYEMESPSYAMVLKNEGHTLKQQHNEQGTYAVEGGS
ncbi:uncharacterized protein UHO2_01134 [Ustilago hordei]|uniref:uncharacterized protein n=1 Tax=Ustilago hordei TaxID=120017 RepID=UPI001A36A65E|nr:uncharacterized protein UHO2_01134 [Ustilago hordei]SYW74269.1 uncharacterized protein UHO2_01134 [Ustilago hordei]